MPPSSPQGRPRPILGHLLLLLRLPLSPHGSGSGGARLLLGPVVADVAAAAVLAVVRFPKHQSLLHKIAQVGHHTFFDFCWPLFFSSTACMFLFNCTDLQWEMSLDFCFP